MPLLPKDLRVVPRDHHHLFKEADVLVKQVNGRTHRYNYVFCLWLGWQDDEFWVIEIDSSEQFSFRFPGGIPVIFTPEKLFHKISYTAFCGSQFQIGMIPLQAQFDNEITRREVKEYALQCLDKFPYLHFTEFLSTAESFVIFCWTKKFDMQLEHAMRENWKDIDIAACMIKDALGEIDYNSRYRRA